MSRRGKAEVASRMFVELLLSAPVKVLDVDRERREQAVEAVSNASTTASSAS